MGKSTHVDASAQRTFSSTCPVVLAGTENKHALPLLFF
jgi:hypothetical protein